ncbi:MAG: hypothetical protein JSU90_03955, partial [Nitrospiraceae bacterium]
METALSTVLGAVTEELSTQGEQDGMSIAEFSALIRDVYYPAGMNEALVTGHGSETGDGLRDILMRCNDMVARGDVIEAMKGFRMCISQDPADSVLHFKLGICSLMLSDRRSALEEYKIL